MPAQTNKEKSRSARVDLSEMNRTGRHGVVINHSKAFTGESSKVEEMKPVTGESLKVTKEMDIPNHDGIYAVRFNPQKDVLAVGFGNGTIKVFGLTEDGEEELYKLTAPSNKSAPIFSIRFHPHRETRVFYATGPLGFIYMSRLRSQTFQSVASETNQTMAMDINATGDQLVTAGNDLIIRFYDPKTMQVVNMYDSDEMNKDNISGGNYGHTLRIQAVKFHPQHPDMLVTGGWDKMVKIWDRRFANGLVKTIIGPYIYGDGIDIRVTGLVQFNRSVTCCHTAGNRIAAGSTDGSLKIMHISHGLPDMASRTYVRRGLRRRSQQSAKSKTD